MKISTVTFIEVNPLTASWTHKSSLTDFFISKLEGIIVKFSMSSASMSR